jgi:hypothetical protein
MDPFLSQMNPDQTFMALFMFILILSSNLHNYFFQ